MLVDGWLSQSSEYLKVLLHESPPLSLYGCMYRLQLSANRKCHTGAAAVLSYRTAEPERQTALCARSCVPWPGDGKAVRVSVARPCLSMRTRCPGRRWRPEPRHLTGNQRFSQRRGAGLGRGALLSPIRGEPDVAQSMSQPRVASVRSFSWTRM